MKKLYSKKIKRVRGSYHAKSISVMYVGDRQIIIRHIPYEQEEFICMEGKQE